MQIQLFNGFMNPYGGSEQETLFVYELLKRKGADVRLWATSSRVSADLMKSHPIRRISILKGDVPRGGTYIFFGAHWRNKPWPMFLRAPRRLIYVFNTFHPKVLGLVTHMPFWLRWPAAEMVLISQFQGRALGLTGAIHPSPIDIDRFRVRPSLTRTFTIGRMSRDTADKHHAEDPMLYHECIARGISVYIQGGTVLKDRVPESATCHLLAEGFHPPEEFFRHIDVFVYRTGTHVETFGRVVLEAMACGIPVVCHSHGGYADQIRHGENGFLFETTDAAVHIIEALQRDQALREKIGSNGRKTVESMYSETALSKQADFYLAEPSRV